MGYILLSYSCYVISPSWVLPVLIHIGGGQGVTGTKIIPGIIAIITIIWVKGMRMHISLNICHLFLLALPNVGTI